MEMPPPSDDIFDRESRDLLADLELFVDGECAEPASRQPVGLEVSFGQATEEDEEASRSRSKTRSSSS